MNTTSVPGRWVEGVGLLLGPLFLLAGVLTRVDVGGDFFPYQLAAYAREPERMVVSYSLFAVGVVLLWPAATAVARLCGPGWGRWGLTLVVLGLFGRAFHLGVSHLAFQLVDVLGLARATKVVESTYGAFHVFKAVNVAIMGGWLVLAIGAFRAKALPIWRCVALALGLALPLGVLKGSSDPISFVAVAGLIVAMAPLGIRVLREGPAPRWWAVGLVVAFIPAAFWLGLQG